MVQWSESNWHAYRHITALSNACVRGTQMSVPAGQSFASSWRAVGRPPWTRKVSMPRKPSKTQLVSKLVPATLMSRNALLRDQGIRCWPSPRIWIPSLSLYGCLLPTGLMRCGAGSVNYLGCHAGSGEVHVTWGGMDSMWQETYAPALASIHTPGSTALVGGSRWWK